jgi:SAM-dependent methyltransferase
MSYEGFAYIYDELMEDAPYDKWVQFVTERLSANGITGRSLLDLGCGTGELTLRLVREGFTVTGVDLSADMLAVARAKAQELNLSMPFYQQDMADLEGLGQFDVIGIFCDSLNYLHTEEEVERTFTNAFRHLKDGGVLFFDVHSIYKMNEIFINQTFTLNEDRLAYIWNSFPGDFPDSVEHELSFFVLDERSGKYDRIDEFHQQRTFSVARYQEWLEKAGFEVAEISADFEAAAPQPQSERIFFMAKK